MTLKGLSQQATSTGECGIIMAKAIDKPSDVIPMTEHEV